MDSNRMSTTTSGAHNKPQELVRESTVNMKLTKLCGGNDKSGLQEISKFRHIVRKRDEGIVSSEEREGDEESV
jgi:hypothetical protein